MEAIKLTRENKVLLLKILKFGRCDENQLDELAKAFNLNKTIFGISHEDDARQFKEFVEKL
jgi:hypothetical protein